MANATSIVKKGVVRRTEEFRQESSATLASETRFYRQAMLGRTTGGYLAKMDDTQSLIFAGVVRGQEGDPLLPAGTAGDGTINLDYQIPLAIELTITSVAVTDIGKPVYALDDQTGTLDASATTYANLVGQVVGVVGTNIALVELAYDGVAGNKRLGAAKFLAATGNQTLSKWDLNKTIFCGNTAALSVTLPAVASCPAGSTLTVVKTSADAQAITLDGNSSETIDGATTLATQDAAYDVATIVSTGAAWVVTSRDIA